MYLYVQSLSIRELVLRQGSHLRFRYKELQFLHWNFIVQSFLNRQQLMTILICQYHPTKSALFRQWAEIASWLLTARILDTNNQGDYQIYLDIILPYLTSKVNNGCVYQGRATAFRIPTKLAWNRSRRGEFFHFLELHVVDFPLFLNYIGKVYAYIDTEMKRRAIQKANSTIPDTVPEPI